MKLPEMKLGTPLAVATFVYVICSLFGCLLYLVLPPFFCSIGARFHTYVLNQVATDEVLTFFPVFFTVIAHIFVLTMCAFGIFAIKTGRTKVYFTLAVAEILLTIVYLILSGSRAYQFTSGILVNIAYCIWLYIETTPFRITIPFLKKQKGI